MDFMEFGASSGVLQVLRSLSQGKRVLASTHVHTHQSNAHEHEAFQFAAYFQFIYIHSELHGDAGVVM